MRGSWNKDLALQRATGLGNEFAKKSLNVIFGPVVGPLGRIATGGRNWEGLGYDPWLSGALVRETIKGIQGAGIIASLKHFVGNEQETRRSTENMLTDNPNDPGQLQAISANIDDKTLHELYLWPFVDALDEGVANISKHHCLPCIIPHCFEYRHGSDAVTFGFVAGD